MADPRVQALYDQYFPQGYGLGQFTPQQMETFIYDTLAGGGLSPQEARFGVEVSRGESATWTDFTGDESLGGSFGPWQLFVQGLLPDFMSFARTNGLNADPMDPIATTLYVSSFINKAKQEGENGWNNWTVARDLMKESGGAPSSDYSGGTGGSGGNRVSFGGGVQFPSEAAQGFSSAALSQEQSLTERLSRRLAEVGLAVSLQQLSEDRRQNAHQRIKDKLDLVGATDALADARRTVAVSALIEAAPYLAEPGQNFPGLGPGEAGAGVGAMLGVNVPNQQIPTQTLPLQQMVDAPTALTPEMIQRELGGLGGETPMVDPGLLALAGPAVRGEMTGNLGTVNIPQGGGGALTFLSGYEGGGGGGGGEWSSYGAPAGGGGGMPSASDLLAATGPRPAAPAQDWRRRRMGGPG